MSFMNIGTAISMVPSVVDETPLPQLPNVDTQFALMTGRKPFHQQNLDVYERHGEMLHPTNKTRGDAAKANLISSECEDGTHRPVIDCDYPVVVIPSSTPGHGHLYIEKALTWPQYKALLDGFLVAGLIEKAWYNNAMADKRTYVRMPHVKKPKS